MGSPFSRALMLVQAIAAAAGDPSKLQFLPDYVSRGKGRAGHSGKKWGPWPSGKYTLVFNGQREVRRRLVQQERAFDKYLQTAGC